MTTAIVLQWGLLLGYGLLVIAALIAGRRRSARPLALGIIFLSLPHMVYYILFLILPQVLDGQQTMLFSLALRYQVLFTGALLLATDVRRRWKR